MINQHLETNFFGKEKRNQSTKPSYKRANKLNYSVVIHSQLKRTIEIAIWIFQNDGQMYGGRMKKTKENAVIFLFI